MALKDYIPTISKIAQLVLGDLVPQLALPKA